MMTARKSKSSLRFWLIPAIFAVLLFGCAGPAASQPVQPSLLPATPFSAPKTTPTAAPTPASEVVFKTSLPGNTTTRKMPGVAPSDPQAIPPGQALLATVNGRKVSILISKVITGKEAASLALEKAPEEMQWVIVQLLVNYVLGEDTAPAQLLKPGQFDILSKGQLLPARAWLADTPAPRLFEMNLLPGKEIQGYVALQAYKDDPAPLLRFISDQDEALFSLPNPPAAFQRTLGPDAIGFANRSQVHQFEAFQQSGPVYVVAFTPEDGYLVSGGDDKLIHVWDIAKGSQAFSLAGHVGSIKDISFSPDGKTMASISRSEIILWDTGAWQSLKVLPIKGIGLGVKFLPDDTLLTISVSGEIRIWDIATGQPGALEMIPRYMASSCAGASVYSFDTNDDGSLLAVALSCGSSVIWRRGKGEVLFGDLNRYKDTRSGKPPLASTITLSPDGTKAAYGAVYYPKSRLMLMDVIDVQNKKVIASVNPMDPDLFTARVAPTNDLTVAGVANSIYAWWPGAGFCCSDDLLQLTGHSGRVTALEFSTNGEILASGDYTGKIILWKGK